MAAKRAERLLRDNWESFRTEAHRLGSLGLPSLTVLVNDNSIFFEASDGSHNSLGRVTIGAG